MGIAFEMLILSDLKAEIESISGLVASMLNFWLPVTSHVFQRDIFKLFILENLSLAIGISILYQL